MDTKKAAAALALATMAVGAGASSASAATATPAQDPPAPTPVSTPDLPTLPVGGQDMSAKGPISQAAELVRETAQTGGKTVGAVARGVGQSAGDVLKNLK